VFFVKNAHVFIAKNSASFDYDFVKRKMDELKIVKKL